MLLVRKVVQKRFMYIRETGSITNLPILLTAWIDRPALLDDRTPYAIGEEDVR